MKNTQHWNYKTLSWDTEKQYKEGNLQDYLPKDHEKLKTLHFAFQRLKNTA